MTDGGSIRSLALPKIASSLKAASPPPVAEQEAWPAASEQLRGYTLPLTCNRTGITVGSINIATVAGHMPMIGQWRDSMILHPLFSLTPNALLHFSKNSWFRYCNFKKEEQENEQLVEKQEQMLRVAALALLHSMTDVRQDVPWMPEFVDVANHYSSLMALSYWKAYLDSIRFKFPSLHISKMEKPELRSYLQTCWSVKKSYETTVNEKIELEKLKAAEIAAIALRDQLAGARPTSNRQLWRWFVANMPKRYSKDLDTWMPEIFFAKGEEIRNFTIKDIDLLEEIFLCECPVGSAISHAFSEILASKRKYLQETFEAFEIVIPPAIAAAQVKAASEVPVAEPQRHEFPTLGKFLIARANWRLVHTDLMQRMQTASNNLNQLTVQASYRPTLVIRQDEPEDEEEQEQPQVDTDAGGDMPQEFEE